MHNYILQFSALAVAVHRELWALCISWIIYSCHRGRGGFINQFFTLPYFKPISKLSYCRFLIHQPLILLIARLIKVPLYFDGWIFLVLALGIYLFCSILSIVWTLMFEIPFVNLEKALWGIFEGQKKEKYIETKKDL